jgi:uncharacterized membrane protein
MTIILVEMDKPDLTGGIDTTGGACRLLEMEHTLLYFVLQFFNLLILLMGVWDIS